MCHSLINSDINVHSVLSYMQPIMSLRQHSLSVVAFLIMYTASCHVMCPRWSSQIYLVRKLLLPKSCLSMLCCVSKFQAHQTHQRVESSQVINSDVDMHYKLFLAQSMTSWRQSSLSVVTSLIMYATSYHPRDVGLMWSLLSIGCLFLRGIW